MKVHFTCRLTLGLLIGMTMVLLHSAFHTAEAAPWEEAYRDEPYIRLLKEVVVRINKDFTYSKTVHIVDKIQSEGGKKLGEIPIRYDQSREEVKEIEAYIVLPDGTRLKSEKIQDLNDPDNFGVYSDYRIKMITMPNVVVGSTIDWKETTLYKKPVVENNFYQSLRFSDYIPMKEVRYRIIAPKGMKLNFKKSNTALEPRIEYAGDEVSYTWEMQNIEKIEAEEYMPSFWDIGAGVTVSTWNDWKQLSDWIWSLYQKNLSVSPEMKKKVQELVHGRKTTTEKIQEIIDYLQTDFRYVSMNIDAHGYEPHPANEIYSNKYGDCKDQTLLAMAMLSEIGISAWPTLVYTGPDFIRADMLPMPFYFNHAILFIELDGKGYYVDVLRKGYYYHEIPFSLAGKRAFVANDHGGFFADIPESDKTEKATISTENVQIREDGMSIVEMKAVFSRNFSIEIREMLKKSSAEKKEKFFASVETMLIAGGKVIERSWENTEVPHALISLTLKFSHPNLVQRMGDMMLFGMPQTSRGTLFSSPKRKYDIVFSFADVTENHIYYSIPAGYEVMSLPKAVLLETSLGGYRREYGADGTERITGSEISFHRHARLSPGEYRTIQDFLDEIPRSTNDKIIIRKKGNNGK